MAYIKVNGAIFACFSVTPKKAPTICSVCSHLGHKAFACPLQQETPKHLAAGSSFDDAATKLAANDQSRKNKHLENVFNENQEDPMGEGLGGSPTLESGRKLFLWGDLATYTLVAPAKLRKSNDAAREKKRAKKSYVAKTPENKQKKILRIKIIYLKIKFLKIMIPLVWSLEPLLRMRLVMKERILQLNPTLLITQTPMGLWGMILTCHQTYNPMMCHPVSLVPQQTILLLVTQGV